MAKIGGFFRSRTMSGEAWTVGDRTITPHSRAVSIRLPFGGFVWNRPVAIVVESAGRTERVPIVDLTRVITVVLSASGVGLAMAAWLIGRSTRE